ncbi:MAG: mannose-1-phosphate guanylyltransferase/mannose-6-phosphate isomerase, partial [SAR116 cluster bacterium]
DLGNWGELSKYISNNQNKNNKNFLLDSKNTFIYSNDRVVAGIGLEDLIIINDDDATLVIKKGYEEKVKDVLEEVRKIGHSSASEHTFENRPWGKFENILDSKICKVKKLTVNPGQCLSLQYHKKRSEHWVVIEGEASVNLNNKNIILQKGESIDIPLGAHHSLGNDTKKTLIVIEVQLGTYFGEDDIIRLSDPYNR